MDLLHRIRTVPDFPTPGILFYDISTLVADAEAWRETVRKLTGAARKYTPHFVAGIEARGFLAAAPLAATLGAGVLMIRKKGKLPGKVLRYTYEKEYGRDTLEIPEGLVQPGQRVLIADDLLATGGTLNAAVHLLQDAGAVVPAALFILELNDLGGREKAAVPVESLLSVATTPR